MSVLVGKKDDTHLYDAYIYSFIICRDGVLKCCVWIGFSLQDSCQDSRRILTSHKGKLRQCFHSDNVGDIHVLLKPGALINCISFWPIL